MTAALTAVQDSAWPPRILLTGTDISTVLSDAFGRTTSNGWGDADSGQTYTISGTASEFSVGSGLGVMAHNAAAATHLAVAGSAKDVDLVASFKIPALPLTQPAQIGFAARYVDIDNYYRLAAFVQTSGAVIATLVKRVGASESTIASATVSGLTVATNTLYTMHAQVIDDTLQLKVWLASNSEPGSWAVTSTDTAFSDGGAFGVYSVLNTGNTNTHPYNVSFDDLTVQFPTPLAVTIYRTQGGVRTPVRGADGVSLTDTSIVRNDGEYPFGQPLTYVLTVEDTDLASASLTPTLPGGNVVLSDAITGLAVETQVFAWPDRTATRAGTQFAVGGRNVFVSAPRSGAESQLKLATMAASSRDQMLELLENATSNVVLLRVPDVGKFPGYDAYLAVKSDDEQPWTQRGSDPRRFFTLDVIEVEPWASSLLASGWTLADIEDAYADGTLADIEADFDALLDIEVRDWGEGAPT